jgi:hypothetical protein
MHKMNAQYRKAYMANLQLEVSNDKKNFEANKGSPALVQYAQNGGQFIGASNTIFKANKANKK